MFIIKKKLVEHVSELAGSHEFFLIFILIITTISINLLSMFLNLLAAMSATFL